MTINIYNIEAAVCPNCFFVGELTYSDAVAGIHCGNCGEWVATETENKITGDNWSKLAGRVLCYKGREVTGFSARGNNLPCETDALFNLFVDMLNAKQIKLEDVLLHHMKKE